MNETNSSKYYDNKITQKPIIPYDSVILGSGSFGKVFTVYDNNNNKIAIKVENKNNNNTNTKTHLTLLKEHKINQTFIIINRYLKYINLLSKKNKYHDNILKKYESFNKMDEIIIFNYIKEKNLLLIPDELNINYMFQYGCISETISYFDCKDYNFLTIKLYGKDLEHITTKYYLTENAKYFMALKLLHTLSCFHQCGVVHRDIKLANFVMNEEFGDANINTLYPVLIDFGLAMQNYKYINDKVTKIPEKSKQKIVGTLRYISTNIHEYKNPSIVDDLISLCYVLVVIFTDCGLPWIGHLKGNDGFDKTKHTNKSCSCGYHKNIIDATTAKKNTIAEMKFHTSYKTLVGEKYIFIVKWLKYLYSLGTNQMPSYTYLYRILNDEINMLNLKHLQFEILKNKNEE